MSSFNLSTQTAVPAPSNVVEVTAQNFMQEVMQASMKLPVLVYFTASWCGPCKQFGPMLEKVVNEAEGRVKLARVDVDKNPQIAQQFRVQSVPMVYIMVQGQPLDAFSGAVPESQLKQLIAQLLSPTPEEEAAVQSLEAAQALLVEGNAEQALPMFLSVLAQDMENLDAMAGAISCYIGLGQLDQAETMLTQLPEEAQKHEGIQSARAALTLAKNAPSREVVEQLNARLAKDPLDHAARYELATAFFAGGSHEEAMNELLFIIGKDKQWNEGAARTQLLSFFEALGHTHLLTMQGRRKLSIMLFS